MLDQDKSSGSPFKGAPLSMDGFPGKEIPYADGDVEEVQLVGGPELYDPRIREAVESILPMDRPEEAPSISVTVAVGALGFVRRSTLRISWFFFQKILQLVTSKWNFFNYEIHSFRQQGDTLNERMNAWKVLSPEDQELSYKKEQELRRQKAEADTLDGLRGLVGPRGEGAKHNGDRRINPQNPPSLEKLQEVPPKSLYSTPVDLSPEKGGIS